MALYWLWNERLFAVLHRKAGCYLVDDKLGKALLCNKQDGYLNNNSDSGILGGSRYGLHEWVTLMQHS